MRNTYALLLTLLLASAVHAFFFQPQLFTRIQSSKVNSLTRYAVKPDLFSDDLFDDDEPKSTGSARKERTEPSKKIYLDEKWKLNPDDARAFKGFPKKDGDGVQPKTGKAPQVPVFSLMYKFRKEYVDVSIDSTLADHKGHCGKFKRLLNTELLIMGKSRGVVILWAGFNEVDYDETKAEVMRFVEDDPFILKDMVENWDIIDLTPPSKKPAEVEALPASK